MERDTDDKKREFIANFKKSGGIVCVACDNTGISRTAYYDWRRGDPVFAQACKDVEDAQIDFVESKLLENINAGDTKAMTFYLKTKGKRRGWSEKELPGAGCVGITNPHELVTNPHVLAVAGGGGGVDNATFGLAGADAPTAVAALGGKNTALPVAGAPSALPGVAGVELSKRIKGKKDYIVRLLKEQGKYTAELSMQVNITAQLLVRTELLAEEVLSSGHRAIDVEISREGNERRSVNPAEKLYLDFVQQSQRALRALGMNTDAKERKSDNDSFGEFMKVLEEGG